MIPPEIYKLKTILDSFLGSPKKDLDETYQLQYPCIKCIENKGEKERTKYNLEVNLKLGVYHCWACFDDDMHGSIMKLIKIYGNDALLKDYKETVKSLKESKLYQLQFTDKDFNVEYNTAENKELELPSNFQPLTSENDENRGALEYLFNRGIDWDIIKNYNLGFTTYDKDNVQVSSRIIIPSFNKYGELNYWTGRDFTKLSYRQKYFNPVVERKNIIFNEDKIQWDADITLVEGPFDHIVVPNSIPLLGKSLKYDYEIFDSLNQKANGNINLFLDNDAMGSILSIYRLLNHGRLYNKIRVVETSLGDDPSDIFQNHGREGIIQSLKNIKKIPECNLLL
ncbi:MAG: hypothetical protein IKT40_11960 [Bacilli bacterium]|nr:hypothetical protein [Bacilli bacterium]